MKLSDQTRRLLVAAAGTLVLVGGGVAVGTAVLGDDDVGVATTASARDGGAAPAANGDDYSLRNVTCTTNLFDEPLARG